MKELHDFPPWIMSCPVICDWTEYKGETYFGQLNYDRSELCDMSVFDAAVYGATHEHTVAFAEGYKQALIDFEKEISDAMDKTPDLNVEAWMWSILQKNAANGCRG